MTRRRSPTDPPTAVRRVEPLASRPAALLLALAAMLPPAAEAQQQPPSAQDTPPVVASPAPVVVASPATPVVRASPLSPLPAVEPLLRGQAEARRQGATAQQAAARSSPIFVASAVLPGAAQYLMGDDRWVPYMAIELWALISHVQQRRTARSLEERYRDMAWQVPRRADQPAIRRDTVFEYYEAMTHYRSSGGWLPDGQPERQDGTFNGELWKLARALHFPGGTAAAPGSPAYEAALDYYLRRAIPPGYGWAWGASYLEQQVFADLIRESDAAARAATRYVGLILANHVSSAVDALITTRLRQLSGDAMNVESGPVRYGQGGGWEYGVRIRF